MPVYEFKCPQCKAQFERLVSFSDRRKPAECPECGAIKAERQISAFTVGAQRSSSSCSTSSGGG